MKNTSAGRHSVMCGTAALTLLLASGAQLDAADVTYERLMNPEPQNWLMNHHDYAAQRYSALDAINKSNIKNLKLKFAVALGGSSGNESLEATPLVEDGFMYVVEGWGVVYKIDVRSGTAGHIVWKMDPGQERLDRNRGVALWDNLVVSITSYDGRVIATDKETGKMVWDKNLRDQPDLELTAAPLALKDSIIIGASGGDRGVRDWIASLDARTGNLQWKTYSIPAPGERGSETWKDKDNAWATGGGAFYVTGSYDPASNLTYWGTGNPVPGYDAARRPGDNLYTSSVLALDAANGKIGWYFQYTPNDNRDYDETGTHILIDTKVNGEERKIVSHAGRNGFEYVLDRGNGQFLKAVQHVDQVTWTKGIDPKTGKPVEYDPAKDFQVYAEGPDVNADKRTRRVCPDTAGGTNYWPASYSRRTSLIYIPALESCASVMPDYAMHVKSNFAGGTTGNTPGGGNTSSIVAFDPSTGEVKLRKTLPYPNFAGVLSTAGGIVVTALLDGTIVALDDSTLDELWSINVGTGFNAPPMTYAIDGKQYIAIASGLFRNARNRLGRSPELKNLPNATMIFVFGLD
ncbi:MAG TPA: PQQ-binding-like beta-propeller repeat protein [Xanthobacteraceae bacterium]|nr:PQQ-binding-like beta-propeller repeat protein [Xanthobacteraceae bacterium]